MLLFLISTTWTKLKEVIEEFKLIGLKLPTVSDNHCKVHTVTVEAFNETIDNFDLYEDIINEFKMSEFPPKTNEELSGKMDESFGKNKQNVDIFEDKFNLPVSPTATNKHTKLGLS